MKVKATKQYQELQVSDSVLGRIPEEGEIFEITTERYKLLTHNSYGVKFVEEILEEIDKEAEKEVETEKIEQPKVEKAVKPIKKAVKKAKK